MFKLCKLVLSSNLPSEDSLKLPDWVKLCVLKVTTDDDFPFRVNNFRYHNSEYSVFIVSSYLSFMGGRTSGGTQWIVLNLYLLVYPTLGLLPLPLFDKMSRVFLHYLSPCAKTGSSLHHHQLHVRTSEYSRTPHSSEDDEIQTPDDSMFDVFFISNMLSYNQSLLGVRGVRSLTNSPPESHLK